MVSLSDILNILSKELFSNFLLHYNLVFSDQNLDLVSNVYIRWESIPKEYKDCASMNIYPRAQEARHRVSPGSQSQREAYKTQGKIVGGMPSFK